MKITIVKRLSKKNNIFVALVINDIFVSFDVMTICKVANISPNVLTNMSVGDVIEIN